jgi:hypothetical protein
VAGLKKLSGNCRQIFGMKVATGPLRGENERREGRLRPGNTGILVGIGDCRVPIHAEAVLERAE